MTKFAVGRNIFMVNNVPDYYALLGIPRFSATQDEIRVAYMAQIKFFHPDLNNVPPDFAREITQQLNEAYEILKNSASKRQYDEKLAAYLEITTTTEPSTATGTKSKENAEPRNVTVRPKRKKVTAVIVSTVLIASCLIGVFNYCKTTSQETSTDMDRASQLTEEKLDEWRSLYFNKQEESEENTTNTSPYKSNFFNSGKYDVPDQVVAKPQNGEIIYQKTSTSILSTGPLGVETSGTNDYFIKLRNHSTGAEILSFYVYGGSSVEIEVPLGTYEITYACGTDWYGPVGLFGENTSCYRADSTFSFYEQNGYVNGWTLTLYPVANGNLDTDYIDVSEF